MNSTIRDVARRAGVGLGTVSRVLNNNPAVSRSTRERVLAVIQELGYQPSNIARGLSLGKTLTIATIVPFFTRPSVVERLRGVEAALASSNYSLVVFNVEHSERRNACLRDVPRRERSDGVVIMSLLPKPSEMSAIQRSGVPVVLVDKLHPALPSIGIDDVQGGYMATKHLLELGHRQVAFLGDLLTDAINFEFTSSRDRHTGFCRALDEAGVIHDPRYAVYGIHGRYEARALAEQLLQLRPRPTAIFAASDTQAMGVLEAARDANLRVPEDLSVIGFDDIDIAEYLNLTTVRQPLFETGVRGVELLMEMIAGASLPNQPAYHELCSLEIIPRGTTARIE